MRGRRPTLLELAATVVDRLLLDEGLMEVAEARLEGALPEIR